MSFTEIIFWLIYVGGTVGAVFNPVYGVMLYILVYSVNPETQWWGGNVSAMGLRTSFCVALATGVGMILNWKGMTGGQKQFPMRFKLALFFAAYCICISWTDLQAPIDYRSEHLITKLIKVNVFIFIMIRVIRTLEQFKWTLWTWMAGTIYVGYQAWSGVGIRMSGRLSGGLGGPDFAESSGLAAHLVAMLAIAGFLFYSSQTKRGKFFAILAAAYAVNTIILTRTRNVIPGLAVLVIYGLYRIPKGLRLKCFLGIVFGLSCTFYLTDEGWWNRMKSIELGRKDPSIADRYLYWEAAWAMVHEHPWGVGAGQFRHLVPQYVEELDRGRSAHSTYHECLAEMGYVGFLIFIGMLLATYRQFGRTRAVGKHWTLWQEKNPDLSKHLRELLIMSTAIEVGLTGFLFCAIFVTRLWTEGFWLLMASSCCLHNITQQYRLLIEQDHPDASRTTAAWSPPVIAGVPIS